MLVLSELDELDVSELLELLTLEELVLSLLLELLSSDELAGSLSSELISSEISELELSFSCILPIFGALANRKIKTATAAAARQI